MKYLKIHKPILSKHITIMVPIIQYSYELTKNLGLLIDRREYSINSPLLCLQKIKDLRTEDEIMVFTGCPALFLSIDTELAIESIVAVLYTTFSLNRVLQDFNINIHGTHRLTFISPPTFNSTNIP